MSSTNRGAQRERDDFYATPPAVTEALLQKFGTPSLAHLGREVESLRSFDRIIEPCAGDGTLVRTMVDFSGIGGPLDPPGTKDPFLAFELDEERAKECAKDCLTIVGDTLKVKRIPNESKNDRVLVISNPPFLIAQEIVEWSLRLMRASAGGSMVAMLLRVNFLGSKSRKAFWAQNPAHMMVLSERPKFVTILKSKWECLGCKKLHYIRVEVEDPEMKDPPSGDPPPACSKCGSHEFRHRKFAKVKSDSIEYAWFVWSGNLFGNGTHEVI